MAQTASSEVPRAEADPPFSVLVIDGNEEHQILSVAALARTGAIVRTAASGQQALKLAIANRFDAFVIGSKLRDATGIEVLRLLRDRFPAVPKIFVVPPDGEEAAVRAMKSGATSYIVKTPRYTELLPAIVSEHIIEARNRRRLAETEQNQAKVLTERKTAEDRLSQSETRLRMILRQAPILVWSTDRNLHVTSAMGGGFRGLDTSRSGERGLSLFEYFNVGDEDVEPIASHRRALDGESVATKIEWQGRTYDVRIEPLRSPEGAILGTFGVAFDVTEQRKAEAESERLATIGQLTGFIAHELNTPLTSISLLAHAARKRVKDGEVREKLEKIEKERRRASEIVRELVTLSKNRRANLVDSDLRSVVASAIGQARRTRKVDSRLRIDVEIGDTPVRASIDPLQIQEVVVNLVQNAIDATPEGSIRIRVEGRPGAHAIIVSDTGSGMTPEVRGHLFEPFFTTKPHGEGIGLGLLLSRRIVTDYGGTLEVSSEPGRGSTFTVLLPRMEGA
jgi:signal transduction histidine kinase